MLTDTQTDRQTDRHTHTDTHTDAHEHHNKPRPAELAGFNYEDLSRYLKIITGDRHF